MHKTHAEMQGKVKAASQELKSLKVKEVKLADAIEDSNNALSSTNDQIERAREMITMAKLSR